MSSGLLWPELEPQAVEEGWLADVPRLTSPQVLDALARRHPAGGFNGMPGRWVFVTEVQASTGQYADVQRFDGVAVGLVPSVRYARVIYEVKVSRADWLRELRPRSVFHDRDTVLETRKWDAALALSTEFWYAAPPHCILEAELPPEAGLLEVRSWGAAGEMRARVLRPAPVRETATPDLGFWAAVLRRVAERRAGPG